MLSTSRLIVQLSSRLSIYSISTSQSTAHTIGLQCCQPADQFWTSPPVCSIDCSTLSTSRSIGTRLPDRNPPVWSSMQSAASRSIAHLPALYIQSVFDAINLSIDIAPLSPSIDLSVLSIYRSIQPAPRSPPDYSMLSTSRSILHMGPRLSIVRCYQLFWIFLHLPVCRFNPSR